MGKRLTENLSSLYIGAANRLKPKKARNRIVAYVESYDDVAFWRSIFADFEDDTCYFEVMLPSNKNATITLALFRVSKPSSSSPTHRRSPNSPNAPSA